MTWGWRAHCLSGAAQPEGLQGTRRKAIGCSAKAAGVSATQEGLLPLPNPSTPACLLPSLLQPSASLGLTEQQPSAHLSTEQVARCAPSGERAGLPQCLRSSCPESPRTIPTDSGVVWSAYPWPLHTLWNHLHPPPLAALPGGSRFPYTNPLRTHPGRERGRAAGMAGTAATRNHRVRKLLGSSPPGCKPTAFFHKAPDRQVDVGGEGQGTRAQPGNLLSVTWG